MDSPVDAPVAQPEIHHDHRNVSGGALRPAVFGAMDGLVSNVAVIAGVVGGGAEPRTTMLAGLAVLIGGAFSMATGEYTSVAAQTEVAEREIAVERAEVRRRPAAEEAELAGLYEQRGLDPDLARTVARRLMRDPEQAWRLHAREELGIDPDDLPSPWVAAGSSFVAYAVGALIPLLPYLLGSERLLPAFLLAGVALFLVGAFVARWTVRRWWYAGLRQLLMGAAAAAVTYAVGDLVGAAVG